MQLLSIIVFVSLGLVALAGSRMAVSLYALQQLHASPATVGVMLALFALAPLPLGVLMGRAIDSIGVRRPLVFGALLMLAGLQLPVWLPQVWTLYVAATLCGTGWMLINISVMHAIGFLSTAEMRTRNFSLLSVGYSVAITIAPVLTGFAIDRIGHRHAFFMLSGFAALALLMLLSGRMRLPNVIDPEPRLRSGNPLDLFRNPELRTVYLVGSLVAASWEIYSFIVPIHGNSLGFSASTIGLVIGCFSAGTFVVRLAMPGILRRYTEWQIVSGALLTMTLCFLTLPFARIVGVYMGLSVIAGMALGSCLPNVLTLMHNAAPPGRAGEATGLRSMITNASQLTMPLLIGTAGAAFGMLPVLWGVAAILGTGWRVAQRRVRATAKSG